MEYKDYYRILGVERRAIQAEIKRAYRHLARELHPDVKPNDTTAETRFKEINEAYEVLGDPQKRAKYDRLSSSWQQWQQTGHSPGNFDWSPFASGGGVRVNIGDLFGASGASSFSDFFDVLFGGTGRSRKRPADRPSQSQDASQPIDISLEEAFRGTTRILERDGRRIRATIPPGVASGTRIRLSGLGTASPTSSAAGNLVMVISVLPHHIFRREGDDLHADVSANLYTAVLGGDMQVPTLDGLVQLKVPSGTQNGQIFRLRGRGMPKLRNGDQHGDLYVRIMIAIPTKLSFEERRLYNQLLELQKR